MISLIGFFLKVYSFHDEHYQPVHNLWRTVEDNFSEHSNIKLCIPPASALELFHLLKEKTVDFDIKKIEADSAENKNYNKNSTIILKKYSSIKTIMDSMTSL